MPALVFLVALFWSVSAGSTARAEVVRPAPDIRLLVPSGPSRSLAQFRGQPVVLILASSPRCLAFRRQIAHLRGDFERLASQKTLFIAAFTRETGTIRSNIPFLTAADGAAIAANYGLNAEFGIAIIGRDGNLDLTSSRILPGQRVLDIINNSFVAQQQLRKL